MTSYWKDIGLTHAIGGISPDVLLRLPGQPAAHVLIEVKVRTGRRLNRNQLETYTALLRFLADRGAAGRCLVLASIGSSEHLYRWLVELSAATESFGVLLWEDVLRSMISTGFVLPGLNPASLA